MVINFPDMQDGPSLREDPKAIQEELNDRYIRLRLDGGAGDVSTAGSHAHITDTVLFKSRSCCKREWKFCFGMLSWGTRAGITLDTRWNDPCLWNEPFQPSTVLELTLPDEELGVEMSYREVEISDLPVSAMKFPLMMELFQYK